MTQAAMEMHLTGKAAFFDKDSDRREGPGARCPSRGWAGPGTARLTVGGSFSSEQVFYFTTKPPSRRMWHHKALVSLFRAWSCENFSGKLDTQ